MIMVDDVSLAKPEEIYEEIATINAPIMFLLDQVLGIAELGNKAVKDECFETIKGFHRGRMFLRQLLHEKYGVAIDVLGGIERKADMMIDHDHDRKCRLNFEQTVVDMGDSIQSFQSEMRAAAEREKELNGRIASLEQASKDASDREKILEARIRELQSIIQDAPPSSNGRKGATRPRSKRNNTKEKDCGTLEHQDDATVSSFSSLVIDANIVRKFVFDLDAGGGNLVGENRFLVARIPLLPAAIIQFDAVLKRDGGAECLLQKYASLMATFEHRNFLLQNLKAVEMQEYDSKEYGSINISGSLGVIATTLEKYVEEGVEVESEAGILVNEAKCALQAALGDDADIKNEIKHSEATNCSLLLMTILVAGSNVACNAKLMNVLSKDFWKSAQALADEVSSSAPKDVVKTYTVEQFKALIRKASDSDSKELRTLAVKLATKLMKGMRSVGKGEHRAVLYDYWNEAQDCDVHGTSLVQNNSSNDSSRNVHVRAAVSNDDDFFVKRRRSEKSNKSQENHRNIATRVLLTKEIEPQILEVFAKEGMHISNLMEMLLHLPPTYFLTHANIFEQDSFYSGELSEATKTKMKEMMEKATEYRAALESYTQFAYLKKNTSGAFRALLL